MAPLQAASPLAARAQATGAALSTQSSVDVPVPRPASIELRIVRPGEAAARTFRWQL